MTSATPYVYKKCIDRMTPPDASIDPVNDDLRIALMANTYTPDQDADEDWSDISEFEAQNTSGNGYVQNGQLLTNQSKITSGENKVVYDADNPHWATIDISARYAVVYDDSHANKALIAFIDFGAVKTASGGSFDITLSADGFLTFEARASPS